MGGKPDGNVGIGLFGFYCGFKRRNCDVNQDGSLIGRIFTFTKGIGFKDSAEPA
jgi:hypothetical protein